MALYTVSLLWSILCVTFNQAAPFSHTDNSHVFYVQHQFYDEYEFNSTAAELEPIKIINNPDALLQLNVSNGDDTPEVRIDLPWDFKFYGHLHSWIAISPNGFLTTHKITCDSFCNWGEETGATYRRYIAPLMTDLNPSAWLDSEIWYLINNTEQSLSVQWSNVTLFQYPGTALLPYVFDFQVKLFSNGTILFYYFTLPALPDQILLPNHNFSYYALTIGLEDAAYQHLYEGQYAIEPYAPVEVFNITEHTVIKFVPRTTCIDQLTCADCKALATDPGSNLQCGWCPKLGLCSDGLGRELFEYASDEFCTAPEMLDNLASETCIDYVVNTRQCVENDHVLAQYPLVPSVGAPVYYSAVILEVASNGDEYLIHYDDPTLLETEVAYSLVHPCSTVSFDYSSPDLPPHCVPHCAPAATEEENTATDSSSDSGDDVIRIVIEVVVISLICAGIQVLVYLRWRPQPSDGSERQRPAQAAAAAANKEERVQVKVKKEEAKGVIISSQAEENQPEDAIGNADVEDVDVNVALEYAAAARGNL